MRNLFLCGLLVCLSGCLTDGLNLNLLGDSVRMTPEHAQSIESAGVISLLDVNPRVHFVSSSLLESNISSMTLNDWDANQMAVDLVTARLRQKGFAVKPISTKLSMKEAYSSSASYAEPDRIKNRLIAIGQRHNVDMVVVVYRQLVRDFITKSSQKVSGYGVYRRHSEGEPHAYAAVYVEALNTRKGYTLGKSNASVKVELDAAGWQPNFESEKNPIRVGPVRENYLREKMTKALHDAVIVGAQEIGVSN